MLASTVLLLMRGKGRRNPPLYHPSKLVLLCDPGILIWFLAIVEPKANASTGFLRGKHAGCN
jgi:hypothetical protein